MSLLSSSWTSLINVLLLQASNLLYVDQPTGTGFSFTSDESDIRHDEEGLSNDLFDFLQVWILYEFCFEYYYSGVILGKEAYDSLWL